MHFGFINNVVRIKRVFKDHVGEDGVKPSPPMNYSENNKEYFWIEQIIGIETKRKTVVLKKYKFGFLADIRRKQIEVTSRLKEKNESKIPSLSISYPKKILWHEYHGWWDIW